MKEIYEEEGLEAEQDFREGVGGRGGGAKEDEGFEHRSIWR